MEVSRLCRYFTKSCLLSSNGRIQCYTLQHLVRHASSSQSTSQSTPKSRAALPPAVGHASAQKVEKISKAMKAYLERAKAHDTFMQSQIEEFEIGKRHLATIMGKDPDTFTQNDINRAIEYLLPSGLFDKKARPLLKHPTEVIPKRKAAQFGMDGRPFHSMFYTGQANYYGVLHSIGVKLEELKQVEDNMAAQGRGPDKDAAILLAASVWLEQPVLEDRFQEKITTQQYANLLTLLQRLADQPFSYLEKDVILSYRKELATHSMFQENPPLMYDASGRAYMTGEGKRKTALAKVTIWDKGTGLIRINGQDIVDYFNRIMDREQLSFPLQFTDKLMEVDLECSVEGGGRSGQAGAIRLAMSVALQSFVDREMVEKMRLAGLLTKDPRRLERQKPGQSGARRKFTWKKR